MAKAQLREYPIGTLLVWKTKSKIRRRKFIDNYKFDTRLTDFYVTEDDKQKMLVLDGQQRLQSLFIGLKGAYDKKELCVDILSGDLVAPEDIKYKFKFLLAAQITAPWFKLKDIVFSNDKYNKIADKLVKNFSATLTEEQTDKVHDNVSQIIKQFLTEENMVYQVVDDVDNPHLYNEDDIVEIFIRANSGGTPLGKSDLLFSLLNSSWDEADEKMEELLENLNRTGYRFGRDFILKTCLSIFGKGAAYNVDKFRDIKTRQNIIAHWDDIANAIKDVKDFIYGKTFIRTDATLPSYLVLIPLIYFRYYYKAKWNSVPDLPEYLLRTLLAGAFGGSPDALIDKCTKRTDELQNFDVNEIFGVIRADGRNLEISKEAVFQTYYGSKAIHLFFNLWYNFNYQPAYSQNKPQVDHIFPQSKLKQVKVSNPNTGRLDLLKYKWWERDQIANCMLLTAQENGASGKTDTLPEVWFADKEPAYLKLHLIPEDKELWKLDNFEAFIDARMKLIEEKFQDVIFKT